jgi:hypothetical protein
LTRTAKGRGGTAARPAAPTRRPIWTTSPARETATEAKPDRRKHRSGKNRRHKTPGNDPLKKEPKTSDRQGHHKRQHRQKARLFWQDRLQASIAILRITQSALPFPHPPREVLRSFGPHGPQESVKTSIAILRITQSALPFPHPPREELRLRLRAFGLHPFALGDASLCLGRLCKQSRAELRLRLRASGLQDPQEAAKTSIAICDHSIGFRLAPIPQGKQAPRKPQRPKPRKSLRCRSPLRGATFCLARHPYSQANREPRQAINSRQRSI